MPVHTYLTRSEEETISLGENLAGRLPSRAVVLLIGNADCIRTIELFRQYAYEIDRGPEYLLTTGTVAVAKGSPQGVTNRLRRLVNLAEEGWWSGDVHVHRPPEDIELLMQAEDLHVAPVITWWNDQNPWRNRPPPTNPLVRFDGDRFYHLMGGEDERAGGALLYFNLSQPLEITGAQREYPSPMKFLAEARQHRWQIGKPPL
jgi:hypothetical protein